MSSVVFNTVQIDKRLDPGTTGKVVTSNKGDLISDTGTVTSTLAVGSDSWILVADSAESTGLKWASPSTVAGSLDHGDLMGLGDDDHTQYALLAGRAGGQTLIGGTGAGDDLVLTSTSDGTKGVVSIPETTNCSSPTTGALVVAGGVGIGADLCVDGNIDASGIVGTSLNIDNISIDGNTISSTDTNGNINILPNGTGEVLLKADPVSNLGAVTKQYVDGIASGLDIKESVRVKTDAALPTYTQSGTGVGATLTATGTGSFPSVDGVTISLNDRILVCGLGTTSDVHNGIYTLTDAGSGSGSWVLTRATDADEDSEVSDGMFVFVGEGTMYADSGWVQTTNDPVTVDSTVQVFTQFSGGGAFSAANVGTLGTGVFKQKVGSQFQFRNVAAGSTNLTTSLDGSDNILVDVSIATLEGNLDHGNLAGLTDDDHTQYALLAGRSGGQTLVGGTGAGDDLVLTSTSNGTKGVVSIPETTNCSSPTTGALVVAGGVGIGADLCVDGSIDASGIVGTSLNIDNISIDGNTISSTDVNGDVNIVANGSGDILLSSSGEVLVTSAPTTDFGVVNKKYVDDALAAVSGRIAYQLISSKVLGIDTSYDNLAYFAWVDSRYSGYTNGRLLFEAEITGAELTYRVVDESGNVLVTEATTSGSSFISATFASLPTQDRRVILQFKKASAAANPAVYGVTFEFDG